MSIVTVTILVLALFSINLLLTVNVVTEAAVDSIKDKIDVNLYLKAEADENKITALKVEISGFSQVKSIDYISKAAALENFRAKHENNPEIIDALRELGKNPLSPVFIIKAKSLDEYDGLIAGLNKINSDIIESKNFDDHKTMLAKINNISRRVNQVGVFVSLVFAVITILVVFNAIRVAIYTHSKEIGIMRLVGASNWFVKSPFLVSGIIYAGLGVLITILIYYPFLTILQPYLETFFIDYDINMISYFNSHFITIFGLEFAAAALINALASFTAIGRYSKV